ncbi:MAG: Uma2 family endonuclease [Bryobacterales bacterium]|nr:Uma2 family endonuclease [Bryobacterales bacterium]
MPEYWVVDLNGRRIVVHRDPRDGAYATVSAYAESEEIRPLDAPEGGVAVGILL